jgi:hypothetical protein
MTSITYRMYALTVRALLYHDLTESEEAELGRLRDQYMEAENDEALAASGEEEYDPYEDDLIDGVGFADPGGESALRAATPDNPRDLPCPNCGRENMLTPIDEQRGYQCDICARELEMGF